MVHKTVLRVDVSCDKCKQEVFAIVSKIEGVNKIEADTVKGTIAVIGTADPFAIIKRIRKAGKSAYFESVGPPPKPEEKKDEKKDDKKDEKKCTCQTPCICPSPYPYLGGWPGSYGCTPVAMSMDYCDPTPPCTIM